MPKFHVRFARTVFMEADVEAPDIDAVRDPGLGVYDGIPAELIPDHIQTIEDEEFIWEVTPLDENEEEDEDA